MAKEKTARNKKMKKLSKKYGGDHSYRDLAKRFKVNVKTAFVIVNR